MCENCLPFSGTADKYRYRLLQHIHKIPTHKIFRTIYSSSEQCGVCVYVLYWSFWFSMHKPKCKASMSSRFHTIYMSRIAWSFYVWSKHPKKTNTYHTLKIILLCKQTRFLFCDCFLAVNSFFKPSPFLTRFLFLHSISVGSISFLLVLGRFEWT